MRLMLILPTHKMPLRLSLLLLVCASQVASPQVKSDGKATVNEPVFTASKIFSLLQMHFFPLGAEAAADLDGRYKEYLTRVLSEEDRVQFDLATIEFVAQQQNGHTFFWDTWLNKSNNEPLGFYALPLDGKWVVQTSSLRGLKPGDVISKIDDLAIEAFFLEHRRYISASSTVTQPRNLFLFPYLFPEQFTLTLEDSRHVTVDRTSTTKTEQKTEGRWLKKGAIAYIRIPSFFDALSEQMALGYVRQFRKAGTLIIDVRDNPGGIPPQRLIRALMNRPYRRWSEAKARNSDCADFDRQQEGEEQSNRGSGSSAIQPDAPADAAAPLQRSRPASIMPSGGAFQGRLIFLVNGGCVSACEDLIEPSKDSGRATIIGETTQGSSGSPLAYNFHNGMTLRIAIKRYYFPDGSGFEGAGIKPDIEVHTTIDDLKNSRDPILERALKLAEKP